MVTWADQLVEGGPRLPGGPGPEEREQARAEISGLVTQAYGDNNWWPRIFQVVSRGRLAPGDEQWPRGGQTDKQADQGQGHGPSAQGLVQVVGESKELNLNCQPEVGIYINFSPNTDTP